MTTLRKPTAPERELLARLLSVNFPGRAELMQQAQDILVETIDSNGSLRFAVSSDIEAPVTKRIPIEAQFLDTDGIWIHALLHVVHGRLTELEIYKDDSSNVIKAPNAADWEILLLG